MDEPQVTCPEDWTPEQIAEFRKAWEEHWATAREHRPIWLPPIPEAKRRQQVVVHLKWTEDGQPRQELFGPWTQGDPETEEGGLAHMVAAHGFLREWCRVTGIQPDEATAVLVLDPEQWLRERGQQQKGSDDR